MLALERDRLRSVSLSGSIYDTAWSTLLGAEQWSQDVTTSNRKICNGTLGVSQRWWSRTLPHNKRRQPFFFSFYFPGARSRDTPIVNIPRPATVNRRLFLFSRWSIGNVVVTYDVSFGVAFLVTVQYAPTPTSFPAPYSSATSTSFLSSSLIHTYPYKTQNVFTFYRPSITSQQKMNRKYKRPFYKSTLVKPPPTTRLGNSKLETNTLWGRRQFETLRLIYFSFICASPFLNSLKATLEKEKKTNHEAFDA